MEVSILALHQITFDLAQFFSYKRINQFTHLIQFRVMARLWGLEPIPGAIVREAGYTMGRPQQRIRTWNPLAVRRWCQPQIKCSCEK